jgi:anti-anti-sigma factor
MSDEPMVLFEELDGFTVGTIQAGKVLDTLNVTDFGEVVLRRAKAHPGMRLILDFSQVHYLSSAVLTELLRIKDAVEESGGGLRLCSLRDDIRQVFAITNLDQVLSIDHDVAESHKRFARALEVAAESEAWQRLQPDP